MQAMDRAHRLGQKRTVHVYRLLMRDSLEERIMSLQRFKVDVANAVINQVSIHFHICQSGAVASAPMIWSSSFLKSSLTGLCSVLCVQLLQKSSEHGEEDIVKERSFLHALKLENSFFAAIRLKQIVILLPD